MNSVIQILSAYQLPGIFLGAFLFGETVIITAAFLSAHGIFSVINVFWMSLAGTIVSDSLWFFGGKYFFSIIRGREKSHYQNSRLLERLETISGNRPFLLLLFIKFLYGTRILTIIYLSFRKILFLSFFIFDTLGTIFWLAVIITLGWIAGKGVANFMPLFDKTEYVLSFLLLLIIIFKLITLWAKKKIIKE